MTYSADDPCGLSHKELAEACRNIGFDLECGACAERFFTGGSWGTKHDEGCGTNDKIPLIVIESPLEVKT